jgi:hypothetical protein
MKSTKLNILILSIALTLSCETQEVTPNTGNASFSTFTTNGQTLSTAIHTNTKQVSLEVDHDVDVTALIPEFDIPEGHTVYVNGREQISGVSQVDFSEPVTYTLKDNNSITTSWNVEVTTLGCKILIDASHDGGVWWFPQYEGTGFNPDSPHQGQAFANALRAKGFEVTELGRGKELTEEMFFGHYIVIRVMGFQAYTAKELNVYSNLLNRGMNLVFITDHKQYDSVDELGTMVGVNFEDSVNGTITTLAEHEITTGITSIDYIAGSVITNADTNPDLEVLGWLENDAPVMGIIHYPNSRIFCIGDTNGIEVQPQPFIDNLINWMGNCHQW